VFHQDTDTYGFSINLGSQNLSEEMKCFNNTKWSGGKSANMDIKESKETILCSKLILIEVSSRYKLMAQIWELASWASILDLEDIELSHVYIIDTKR